MSNKQNHLNQLQTKRLFSNTQAPKPRQRYPLKDLDDDFNSIQLPPEPKSNNKNHSKASLHLSQSSNEKQFFNFNKSQLVMSMKQKFKAFHISSINSLIGSAREKKSQIEDLLNKQQQKAFSQELDQSQISASFRKLKKVVRLMEIVCKIILGKNEQNNFIDLSSQQDIIIKDMHSVSIQNFQRQLQYKEREIEKLKKLVDILSIPDEGQLKSSNQSNSKDSFTVNNSVNSGVKEQIEFQIRQYFNNKTFADFSIQTEKQIINKKQIAIQTEKENRLEKIDCSIQSENNKNLINSITQTQLQISPSIQIIPILQQNRLTRLSISQQYSIWNILDANFNNENKNNSLIEQTIEKDKPKDQNSLQITLIQETQAGQLTANKISYQNCCVQTQFIQQRECSTQTDDKKKMSQSNRQHIQIQQKLSFLKRYKSIVKLAINSLNLSNNVFLQKGFSQQQSKKIYEQIQKISQYFNQEYHNLNGKYNDDFCKQTKEKIDHIYQKIYNIYQDRKKDFLLYQQIL